MAYSLVCQCGNKILDDSIIDMCESCRVKAERDEIRKLFKRSTSETHKSIIVDMLLYHDDKLREL